MPKKIWKILKSIYQDWKWHWRENLVAIGVGFVVGIGFILLINLIGLPEHCSLCEGIRYHAPCFVDLSTGEVVEMELFEPHPKLVAEIANYTPPGNWGILCGAGLRMDRDRGNWTVNTRIPHNVGRMDFSKFCYPCRLKLMRCAFQQYAIVDLYDREHPRVGIIKNGAQYSVRCYVVTVSVEDGILITLQGLVNGY